ncbi:SDR family oxidoreductase [Sphingomonas profundi]|uniref:SDR family oxidoreductase n=1 Tax=Alterirhizorhabdus profundi TaxID=2681549 RepID=UPI0012E8823E|nr:SDR family oxidoreductase [Sphingomonas profundi]
MTNPLEGSVALVTGASGGIGAATVAAIRAAGGEAIATDVRESEGVIAHDVTSEADWQRIADMIAEKHGRLDCLVNNAGISIVESVESNSLAAWRRVQAINVESILIGLQATLPLLKTSGKTRFGGASVVNFSSVGGLYGAAFNSAYCASKAAVNLFSKCSAIEFAALGYNIRVNAMHPGGVETPMIDSIIQRYVDVGAIPSVAVGRAGTIADHPIGRMGNPEEIANGVVFLLSPAASFMTASSMVIDGGFTAH